MNSNILQELDKITFDSHAHASVNYAKARMAIENNISGRAAKRQAKMIVLQHLNGTVVHKNPSPVANSTHKVPVFVEFPDNSKAQF